MWSTKIQLNVSVKYAAFIFRVKEEANQETRKKKAVTKFCLAHSSTLKMEVTLHYIPEYRILLLIVGTHMHHEFLTRDLDHKQVWYVSYYKIFFICKYLHSENCLQYKAFRTPGIPLQTGIPLGKA
jgi:hypothetical protein